MDSLSDDFIWIKKKTMSHKFNHDIETVWNFLKDVKKTHKALSDLRSDAVFSKGSESYEKDAEFEVVWKNYIKMKFIVIDVVDGKNFKQLHYFVDQLFTGVRYKYIYSFYNVTASNSTILHWEWIYDGEKGFLFNKVQSELIDKERTLMILKLEKFLSTPIENLSQMESVDLPCSAETIWQIITNWPLFRKIVPQICDECAYKGDPEEIGTLLEIKWTKKKKAKCTLKVIKSEFNSMSNIHRYHLHCFEGEPEIPSQELCFTLVEIKENYTLLEFQHNYLEPLESNLVKGISKHKKSILKDLKKAILKMNEKKVNSKRIVNKDE